MMQTPLTMTQMIERAEKYFPKKQVISRTSSGIHRITYKQIGERTRRLADSLKKLGIEKGDRVGTLSVEPSSSSRSLFCDSLYRCCSSHD